MQRMKGIQIGVIFITFIRVYFGLLRISTFHEPR